MLIIKEKRHAQMEHRQPEPRIIEHYKLTNYCIQKHVEEGVLLCHTATGELVLLTDREHHALLSHEPLTEGWAVQLADRQFLVDQSTDEYALVEKERRESRKQDGKEHSITSFTILPTSRCNARCFYCYEKGIPQKNMSRQTAEDVAEFIIRSCHGKKVHLGWFGGEPTVAHPIITLICTRLTEKGIEYSSSMISNGLLLSNELTHTAKNLWKLKNAQITIDGTESIYNAVKDYKGQHDNPYCTVLNNISGLLENGIHISVRINLGLHNFEDVSELIEQLTQRFSGKKLFSAYVHEINNYYDEVQSMDLLEKAFILNQRLIDRGLQAQPKLPSLRLHSCMADSEDSVLINPDGQLGKCEHYAFEKLHGSIYNPHRDESILQSWRERSDFDQCKTCPFFASCYLLKWCNGGSDCNEGKVKIRTMETQSAMMAVFNQWNRRRMQIRNAETLRLTARLEFAQSNGREVAEFYPEQSDKPIQKLAINSTAKEILLMLRAEASYKHIINRLKRKYRTENCHLEESVEEYLLFLVRRGICH